jgi:cytochrome P450 / NADPH-cytochrome P450 reductase
MKTEPRPPKKQKKKDANVPAAREGLVPIPRPPAKPVVGHMLDLDPSAPIQSLMKIAQKMGPIFELEVMNKPFTVVSGFDIVDELCDEKRFDKSVGGPLGGVREIAGDGLFTAYTSEPNWSKAHHILLPNFGDRAMQSYHPMMLDVAEQMCQKWERLNSDDEIDVVHDMTALTLDTIGMCGFGYRFNSFYRDDNHPFVNAMVQSLEIVMQRRGYPLEDIVRKDRVKALRANVEYMNNLVDRIIQDRKQERAGQDDLPKRDLLDYMLDGIDRKTGTKLDDVNIRYQIITFLIAGHETTSGMLSFTMYYLLNNPDVLAKAYEEVDRILGTDLSVQPTMKQVNSLTYVGQILKESLRMWPTAPAFSLRPYKDEVVGGKYFIKGRSYVTLLLPMLHRDPAVWGDNAETFDPEHFSPDAEAARPQNAYKPFGNGQRACIGRQFALQESALVFGMLLQRFKFIDHNRYQLRVKETLTIKPEGLKIRVRPRVHKHVAPKAEAALSNGAAGHEMAAAPPPPERAKHGTPLLVLFGSNLGTSEDIARHVAETGTAQGYDVTLGWLDDFVGKLPTVGAVVIVTASYNGAPPDNAAAFYKWLQDGLPENALAGVKFTVFGAGNRNWDSTYQAVPRFIDEKLAKYGAERLYERGEGDARDDLDAHFQAWKAPLWQTVSAALGVAFVEDAAVSDRPMYEVHFVPGPQPNPLAAAHGARGMFVVENRELQTSGVRSTRHVEVSLPSGATYRSGDHLGVLASNGQALVDRVLKRFGLDATTYVRLQSTGPGRIASLPLDATLSVRRLLMHYVELQQTATRKQIATLAEHTQCPNSKPALLRLASGDDDAKVWREEIKAKRTTVIDLLERYPACELPLQTYLEMLPLMTPRYYSISSSPLATPNRASITVGVVREPAYSGVGLYEGIASTHIARREAGTRLFAFVKESKSGFALPANPETPIIMVGPGTGLAPFRGFLQERAALAKEGTKLGSAMLFFGCRHPEQDFIYREELEGYANDGLVDLQVAFSREGDTKIYVQDLIERRSDEVWAALEAGAIVYVCGDGSRMEPQVRAEFESLYRAKTNSDDAESAAWLADLTEKRRYVLDVWASV